MADKFNLSAAGLTRQTVASLLDARAVDRETIVSIENLLDRCDLYRFSSSAPDRSEKERAYQEAAAFIDKVEKAGK